MENNNPFEGINTTPVFSFKFCNMPDDMYEYNRAILKSNNDRTPVTNLTIGIICFVLGIIPILLFESSGAMILWLLGLLFVALSVFNKQSLKATISKLFADRVYTYDEFFTSLCESDLCEQRNGEYTRIMYSRFREVIYTSSMVVFKQNNLRGYYIPYKFVQPERLEEFKQFVASRAATYGVPIKTV